MRQGIARYRRLLGITASLGVLVLLLSACLPELIARAQPSPSDPTRATFVPGNVTTCAALGFGTSIQVGAQENNPASDPNVSGVVVTNAGPVNPGQGEELNVTITGGPNVV